MAQGEWLPDPYILALTGLGLLIALVAWLPLALKRLPLSLPIVCFGIGAALFSLPQVTWRPLPYDHLYVTERFTEFVVIIALMGAGLKLDRVFEWRRWMVAWRLLAITMPLSIAAITGLAGWALGLPFPVALLLAASLAPTDPVLAADVQVGPPKTGEEDEVRFGLTAEAGLNDGLAFPFVQLAIALAAAAGTGEPRFAEWLTFHVPAEKKLVRTDDGLIAIAATLVSYGLTEIIHSYGFLAVFVTALTFRRTHREHDFQTRMHEVTEQVERLAMMILLLLFGGALIRGLLSPVTWIDACLALVILLVIRPVAGLIGLAGFQAERIEKLTLAFFGIRGVGSLYYLSYGLNRMDVAEAGRLWGLVGLVILLSILLHGLTVTPIMRSLDRRQGRDPDTGEALQTRASS